MTPDLRLVYGCPKWCTEDHTIQAGEDREYHSGEDWSVRLPDGTLIVEARLVHEAGQQHPQLALFGPGLDALKVDDVTLLDAEGARQLENSLQSFTQRVQRSLRTLRSQPSSTPDGKKCKPGKNNRAGWRETRLYLAERDGRRCFYCRTEFDLLKGVTIDHYVPKSVWPCNMPANLVLACDRCNQAKGDRLTWSMAAVLLAWAGREAAEDGNGAPGDVQAPPARSLPDSLTA